MLSICERGLSILEIVQNLGPGAKQRQFRQHACWVAFLSSTSCRTVASSRAWRFCRATPKSKLVPNALRWCAWGDDEDDEYDDEVSNHIVPIALQSGLAGVHQDEQTTRTGQFVLGRGACRFLTASDRKSGVHYSGQICR